MKKKDYLNRCVFVRKIDFDTDKEFNGSFFNKLFNRVVENRNPDCFYEHLWFYFNPNDEIYKFGRLISEELIMSKAQKGGYDGEVFFDNGEIYFEETNYQFRTTNFEVDLEENIELTRRCKETNDVVNLYYNMLIL
ncbi:hypothetical protein [Lacinutrix salivirga]